MHKKYSKKKRDKVKKKWDSSILIGTVPLKTGQLESMYKLGVGMS